ncbi:MAG TPA: ATP-dependent DNA helicase [Actinomycetota bacterium]|nr:ATP-dependent DNA helicase [Actinomycetota bacterium]
METTVAQPVASAGFHLDPSQQEAVDHKGGPLLVAGSPGTGKTTVLLERWVRLASEGHPHRVLLLVTSRRRALELRDVLPWRLPARALVEVPVHTWHAFAYHLVTRYYRLLGSQRPPVLLTAPEQWSLVAELLATEDPGAWGDYAGQLRASAFVGEVADFVLRAGHRCATPAELEELAEKRPDHEAVVRFALRYREHLARESRLDYAGLVGAAARLLDLNDEVRDQVRHRFPHVLVDDAQELAPAQLALLRRLSTDSLVCAGDPDSAIEAFRGADPSWLARFAEVAPGHDTVVLPTVHRHGPRIGGVTSRLISHAPDAGPHRATEWAAGTGTAELRCHSTMAGEVEAAAREVRAAHLGDGLPYERMAILVSQPAAYLAPLQRTLDSLGVPHRTVSGGRPLSTEPSVRAVLDMCRVALIDQPDDALLASVLASPLITLDPHRIRELRRMAYAQERPLNEVLESDGCDQAAEFCRLRDTVRADPGEPADATFVRLFEASRWCTSLAAARAGDEKQPNLDALISLNRALGHFVERRPGATMRMYLETTAQSGVEGEVEPGQRSGRGVTLLSFHAAKGLEWDLVCVLGVSEGQIPKAHRAQGLFDPWALELGSAVDRAQAQLVEERRTLYVALSRARTRLVVSTSPGTRRAAPSRFLEESFGEVPEPVPSSQAQRPLTIPEMTGMLRRTLSAPGASHAERSAAAAALAVVPSVDPSAWWWRRPFTAGQPLTPDGKLTTSYSRIGKYDNCPLQYVLESVLGLDPTSTYQMKFGSLIHGIFEEADPLVGQIKTLDEAKAIYKTRFVDHHKDDYPNVVFARTYYKAGMQMIKRWWAYERERGRTVAVEFAFDDLIVEGHTIRGRIDRVAHNGSGLVLSDYKTSSSALAWQEAKDSLQLAIYYLAARSYPELIQHGEPVSMQLVYPALEHTDRTTGDKSLQRRYQKPEEAQNALAKLEGILAEAAAERFDPSPTADCQWCRMKPLCPRWPEGREVPA